MMVGGGRGGSAGALSSVCVCPALSLRKSRSPLWKVEEEDGTAVTAGGHPPRHRRDGRQGSLQSQLLAGLAFLVLY